MIRLYSIVGLQEARGRNHIPLNYRYLTAVSLMFYTYRTYAVSGKRVYSFLWITNKFTRIFTIFGTHYFSDTLYKTYKIYFKNLLITKYC